MSWSKAGFSPINGPASMHSPSPVVFNLAREFGRRWRGRRAAFRWLLAALLGYAVLAAALPAAAQTPNTIFDIRIEGATQVAPGPILARMSSRINGPVNPEKITRDLKEIYALGFFQDIRAHAEEVPGLGYILVITVVEKPRITAIRIVGRRAVSKTKFDEAIVIRVGSTYSERSVANTIEKIRKIYRDEGYYKVKVTSRIERFSERQFGLTFVIEESPRVYVTRINTRNNKVLSTLEIRRIMATAEVDCFNWVNGSGVFDEVRINEDLRAISGWYLTNGYIRLAIDKPKVELIHNRSYSRVNVLLTLNEGEQYFTGKVDIAGDILGTKDDLLDRLRLKPGDVYNPFRQNRDVFQINEIYQEQGYAFVRVVPQTKIDDARRLVDVTYRIIKGEKAYIGRIEFQGNRETRDYVMRREFEIRENELYNGRKLRLSQENLRSLGYFQPGIALDREPSDVSNILNINIKVQETQTGTLQAQVGFSDQSGITTSLSISKGNLFGRGQTIRASLAISQRGVTRNLALDFIEPHLFDSDYSSDSSIQLIQIEDQTELDRGTINEIRLSEGLGFKIFRRLRGSVTYAIVNRDFEDADEDRVRLRTVTPALRYSSVNHPIFPSTGTSVRFAMSQIGGDFLGGTSEYRRYRFQYQRFISLNERGTVILMGRMRLGFLESVGNSRIPSEDRFRIGGIATIHGYQFNEIGGPLGRRDIELNLKSRPILDEFGDPVLDVNGNPLTGQVDVRTIGLSQSELDELQGGGIFERIFNLEFLFPLTGDNIRGAFFYDAANVNAERRQYQILDEPEPDFFELLQSVGTGIRVITPVGVLRFEYGTKLFPEKGESPDRFDFTISTLF